MKKALKTALALIDDVCYLAGAALVALGAAQIYAPAGYIAAGAALIAYAILIAGK